MSLLDDAREFAKYPDTYEGESETGSLELRCSRCDSLAESPEKGWPSIVHEPGCPWLSLPRIVAALEAAQVLLNDPMGVPEHEDDGTCWFCGQGRPQQIYLSDADHAAGCSWKTLVVALRGEEAKPA